MGKIFKTILFGLPLVILGACSDDDPVNGGNDGPTVDKSEVRYLKVNLVNAGTGNSPASRAIGDTPDTDYANGTQEENKIRTIDFYLYDADKNFHSHVPLSLTGPVDPTTAGVTNPSVHGFYETNIPVNLVQGEKMPTYVICIVNAVNASFYENRSMMDAQRRLLESFYSPEDGGNKYLGMNNSVYYGRDEVTGLDNQLIMATPFDTNKLLTETELDNMTDAELEDVTIDIYVERYAAKVNFNISANAVKDFVTANGITLSFEPKGWGMNAYEKKFYFIKSYRATADIEPVYDDYATMNGILFPGWNRPDHFRSFWARTPAYYDNDYPIVADDILDENTYPYSVYYQSFATAANSVNSSQYVMETTLKGSRLTGADMPEQYLPLTSIPSVVLTGQYKINGSAVTFYTYQKDEHGKPQLYAANDGDIAGVETIHDRLLSTQSIILKKVGSGYSPVREADLTAGSNIFAVEHPAKDVRHGLKIGGDLVTLQIKAANSGFYFYDSDTQAYVEINSPDNITKANRLLYQNLGGAHAYINGMAFFSAPIQHWGWQREDNENKPKPIDEWDWSKMKTGDFGIVRNHIYNIQITNIAGLGTGIIDEDDPLLPPTDKVSYAVNFRVNIQKWATLPTQEWEW